MRSERAYMSLGLAQQLDALATERNGKVACIVVFTEDEIEFCWPGAMDQTVIDVVEEAMLDALIGELADRPWNGPGSR